MHRLAVAAILALALAACSDAAGESIQPVPDGAMELSLPLDLAAARQTVIDFLEGYAAAPQDSGRSLERTLGSQALRHWAHWLNVSLAATEGTLAGEVEIDDITPALLGDLGGLPAIQLDLRATVRFVREAPDGDMRERVYDFTGPATLVQAGTGVWVMYDVTRDGQSILRSIGRANQEEEAGGVTIRLVSLFNFPGLILVNLEVHNRSDDSVRVDAGASGLLFGGNLAPPGLVTPILVEDIEPGAQVEGQLTFSTAALPDADGGRPSGVRITLVRGPKPLVFEFSLQGEQSPSPGATESPGATASPTPTATAG